MLSEGSIYLDSAATLPVDEGVLEEMLPYMRHAYGNPSSVHSPGRQARHAVEEARNRVADVLNCEPSEIIFTGNGTEANNLALSVTRTGAFGKRLITGSTEHEAILRPAEQLADMGIDVTFLAPEPGGSIAADTVQKAIGSGPATVSIMAVNNVTGAANNIGEISKIVHAAGGCIHTDAIQAGPYYDLAELVRSVDLLSLSAHKIRGPKGVGLLFCRGGIQLEPVLRGGKQERSRRSGTENVPGIIGFARALELARQQQHDAAEHVRNIRHLLESEILRQIDVATIVVTPRETEGSAPHILSIIFLNIDGIGLDGEMLVLGMDLAGVYVSTGSACSSGAVEPSHIYESLKFPPERARGAIRFSLNADISENTVLVAAKRVSEVVNRVGGNHR